MKDGNSTNKHVYSLMLFLPGTLLTSEKEHQTIIAHNTNRHCRVHLNACVGQPLSKVLYIHNFETTFNLLD